MKSMLTNEQVKWARETYAAGGVTIQALANQLGIATHSAMRAALIGETYNDPACGLPVKTHRHHGTTHPRTKLTAHEAFLIMQDYTPVWGSLATLAKRFKVDPSVIRQVLLRKTFQYVTPPENFKGYTAAFEPKPEARAEEILQAAKELRSIAAAARKLGIRERTAQDIVKRHRQKEKTNE